MLPANTFNLSAEIQEDLRRSAIPLEYAVDTLKIYPHPNDPVNQYVLPYFHLDGTRIHNYFRIKLLTAAQSKYQKDPPKYLSPPGSSNHLYIPPDFSKNLKRNSSYFVITEGEKKAASISRLGFPCVGLPGIDSWRTTRITVSNSKLTNLEELKGNPELTPILELQDSSIVNTLESRVVPELASELLTFLRNMRLRPTIYLIFDRDPATHPQTVDNVSKALFELSFWLTQQHFEDVWSIALPIPPEYQSSTENTIDHGKVGLDDLVAALSNRHSEAVVKRYLHDLFTTLDTTSTVRYKPHPHNLRYWLQTSLDKKSPTRQDKLKVGRALINGLDNLGQRFYDDTQTRFYFLTHSTHEVFEFTLSHLSLRDFHTHPFGQYLGRTFGINSADSETLIRMANLYTTSGSQSVTPRRVSHATIHNGHGVLYVQLTDSQLLRITSSSIDIVENGSDGQLFISGVVTPISIDRLNEALLDEETDSEPNWFSTLSTTTLQPIPPLNIEDTISFIGSLFYLAPWFRRFRGLQLPIEMAVAEPGSGKSFLYKLRQGILTGNSREQSVPQQLRDWYTSITNGGDLWVGDNVNALHRDLKQVLADELCRITTSESPSITVRQLYTTNTVARLEIPCTFAFTAIQNPFVAEDFVQRAVFMHFDAIKQYDADWVSRHLRADDSGRERWLAHMVKVAQRFLDISDREWNPNFKSGHRLMHFEQALLLMSKATDSLLGQTKSNTLSNIIKNRTLETINTTNVTETSPILQALLKFAEANQQPNNPLEFNLRGLTDWLSTNTFWEFGHINILQNPIALGKYIAGHSSDVYKVSGIKKLGKQIKHSQGYSLCAESERALRREDSE